MLPLPSVLAGAVVAATAGLRHRRRGRIRRAAGEGRALETALDVLVGELRPARIRCARSTSPPARPPAGRGGAALGGSPGPAGRRRRGRPGRRVARLGAAEHWQRLALCWRLAGDHGSGIATLMRAAQRDIAERQRFSARVSSSLAGARATAAILAALPVLGVLLGQLIGARPLDFLLGGQVGGWLLLVGATLACAGLLWADRIVDRVMA
ncbi:putative transmembrane protein [Mycobacterium avium MAV_120709_2344]|nr:putative transmembrane protein [Mycobacterium avium MAV_120709_2344]